MATDRGLHFGTYQDSSTYRGKNHLLVIGIDTYEHCRPLNNAVSDAKALVKVLQEKYNFSKANTITCFNKAASRAGIWEAFDKMGNKLKREDNLIIFYAGHGELNKQKDWGYWVPVDAVPNREYTYIRNRVIIDFIKGFPCHHIVLFSDSCFSGSFFSTNRKLRETFGEEPSRWAITSGRNQPVGDGVSGSHSPFFSNLKAFLQKNTGPLLLSELGNKIKISTNADTEQEQTPRAEPLQISGHKGGEFVFVPKNDEEKEWEHAKKEHTQKAYSQYRRKYAKGKYRAEAFNRMKALEGEEAWQEAVQKNNVLEFEVFIDAYPNSRHVSEAYKKIDTLLSKKKIKSKISSSPAKKVEKEGPKVEKKASGKKTSSPSTRKADTRKRINRAPKPLSYPIEMVLVEGGTYTIEETGIKFHLEDFYIGKYPVTRKQWRNVMGEDPSHFQGCEDCPVEKVSWTDAQEFLSRLNRKYPGFGFRLPSEAEWEYAAKGGKHSKGFLYAGSNNLEEVAWYKKNSVKTKWLILLDGKGHPVGQKKPNELGIFDMSGSVWEWCEGRNKEGENRKVVRGGSWVNVAKFCRISNPGNNLPSNRYHPIGFRLCRNSTP